MTNNILIDKSIWRMILKDKLGYSYKRCSSRPLNLNTELRKLKKILFWVKLLKTIRRSSLLVNIDESTISHSIKPDYSWSKKGFPSNVSTIVLKGSISVVTGILSNGVSITGIWNSTIESRSFIEFIGHLLEICRRL